MKWIIGISAAIGLAVYLWEKLFPMSIPIAPIAPTEPPKPKPEIIDKIFQQRMFYYTKIGKEPNLLQITAKDWQEIKAYYSTSNCVYPFSESHRQFLGMWVFTGEFFIIGWNWEIDRLIKITTGQIEFSELRQSPGINLGYSLN